MIVLPAKPTKEENQPNLLLKAPWREHRRLTPSEQEANKTLALASVNAYRQFVDSLFSYYEAVTGMANSRGEGESRSPNSEA